MPTVERMSSVTAASASGTSRRAANGFCTPPVRARRQQSCRMSKANRVAALRSGRRVVALSRSARARLTRALNATAGISAASGSAMPSEKWTNRMVNSCPITATQRISETV